MPSMTPIQRLRQRPFEHAFAVIMLLSAFTMYLSGGGVIVPHLSPLLAVLWIALNLAGGAFVLTGLLWRGSAVMGRALEQVGWFTGAITLTAAVVVLLWFGSWALLPGLLDEVVLVLAMVLRTWFLHDEKRAERAAIALLRRHKRKERDT